MKKYKQREKDSVDPEILDVYSHEIMRGLEARVTDGAGLDALIELSGESAERTGEGAEEYGEGSS